MNSVRDTATLRPFDAPQTESLAIVSALYETLFHSHSPRGVAERAIDAVVRFTGAPSVAIFTLDEEERTLRLLAHFGFDEEILDVGSVLPVEGSLTGVTLGRREIITSDDLSADDRVHGGVKRALIDSGFIGSVISVPLLYQERALGAMNLIFETRHVAGPGERQTLQMVGNVIGLALANAQHVSRIEAEIAERERAQQALEEQRAYLRQIIDLNPNFVFAKDRAGRFILVNRALAEAFGTTVDDLLGKTDADFNDNADEVAHFRRDDLAVMDSLQEKFIPEETITDATGAVRWLQTVKRPIVDENGRADQLLGIATDISERKRAEQAQQRLTAILEATTDFVGVADAGGRAVFLNKAGRAMIGLGPDAPLEMHISDVMPAWAARVVGEEALPMAMAEGAWQGELALIGGDGREIPVSQVMMSHQTADGQVQFLSTIARDITSQKQLARQTRQSLDRRSREVQLTTEITQEIVGATELRDLYQRVVNRVHQAFGYYHTQLLRTDPRTDRLVLEFGYGTVGETMRATGHAVQQGVGLIGRAGASGGSILVPDVAEDGRFMSHPSLPETRGELAVPIKLRDQVLGVLDVQSDVAGRLSEEDRLVLEGLCGQIAVAIESTRLRQEMAERLEQLDSLQRLMRREGWEDYWQAKERPALAYQFDQKGVREAQRAAQNGRHRATPLAIRGEIIGGLAVEDDPGRPLTADEQALIDAVSDQVAEALEAARLFEQTQQALAKQERLTAELETVAEVGINASTLLDEPTLLQSVADLTQERFGFYHVHIYTMDHDANQLVLKAGAGQIGRLMTAEGRAIPYGARSLVARAARTRQGVIENKTADAPDFLPHPLLPDTRAELAAPMLVGDTLMGVLDVQSNQVGAFTDKDLLIQQTLASQVAVALQNATLYAEQLATAERLREVDRLKSEFLASMSHELRTPLNSIIGFADVLLEGLDGHLNPRMEEDVSLIRESGRHLRELIGNILDMSKIEAGMMTLRYELVDMHRTADELIGTARILAQEKGLTLHTDIDPEIGSLYADRTRLMQVLLNLVSNAIKFTEDGSVKVTMRRRAGQLLVEVVDTGIGIRAEDKHIVFEQFRQVDGSLSRKSGGTGLGMPISKELIELHRGEMGVESEVGRGSTFWFTIPYRETPPER